MLVPGCYASWGDESSGGLHLDASTQVDANGDVDAGAEPAADADVEGNDSLAVLTVCGEGDESQHIVAPFQSPELHVIGIYEPLDGREVRVAVERSRSVQLVLSSYEPARWILTASPDTRIERVIVNGYFRPTVDVPTGTAIEIHSWEGANEYIAEFDYEWPQAERGTRGLTVVAQDLTGLALSSFVGCYAGSDFTLRTN